MPAIWGDEMRIKTNAGASILFERRHAFRRSKKALMLSVGAIVGMVWTSASPSSAQVVEPPTPRGPNPAPVVPPTVRPDGVPGINLSFQIDKPGPGADAFLARGEDCSSILGLTICRTIRGPEEGVDGVQGVAGQTFAVSNSTGFSTTNAAGINVSTFGQDGGDGGNGLLYLRPGVGGGGGNGGVIEVVDFGDLRTTGDNADGIAANSVGGRGGDGRAQAIFTSGGTNGGRAGTGGRIQIVTNALIKTMGANSYGIRAQSVGGRGGDGGIGNTPVYSSAGYGNNGGAGGSVTINSSNRNSRIETEGADAKGIYALSVGGGGGSGGSGSLSFISRGASGGLGLDGGEVVIFLNSVIETRGVNSEGVMGQSIGGGGGAGGNASGAVTQGGSGTSAGNGNRVDINLSESVIETWGNNSVAVVAQSIGGGGGSGGNANGAIALGGGGSAAGNGGFATIDVLPPVGPGGFSTIATTGSNSHGIVAQSIGGGGGTGGNSGGIVAVGGSGSSGGSGALAGVNFGGALKTEGAQSHGILVQSIGGGGGSAGNARFGDVTIGGTGGSGGNAAAAFLNIFDGASVTTHGDFSNALVVQSIGGGGGNGGGSAGRISIGGGGTRGGSSNIAQIEARGEIATFGQGSIGMLVQSIGGGGGNAGGALGQLAIGGAGGAGGNGGLAAGYLNGGLTTRGNDAPGIVVESIGGGGGNGGFAISAGPFFAFGVGGGGGSAGNAGIVLATTGNLTSPSYRGVVETQGDRSHGILAQAIGGGGGNGGAAGAVSVGLFGSLSAAIGGTGGAGGSGGAVTINNRYVVTTSGAGAHGLFGQSIGGGGGSGGFGVAIGAAAGSAAVALGVAVGGDGGAGGFGGRVDVTSLAGGSILVSGSDSKGVLAQSVGGGGGNGGISGSLALGAGQVGGGLSLALGGKGGTASSGGIVNVRVEDRVSTEGDNSQGILAQSVGGGGGVGGSTVSVTMAGGGTAIPLSLSLAGPGGAGGNGASVNVSVGGRIETQGVGSHGVVAQSVGGGGGSAGAALSLTATSATNTYGGSISLGGRGGSGGAGGAVTVDVNGVIVTEGDRAYGVLAQSVGGGGGSGGASVSGSLSAGQFSLAPSLSIGGNGESGNAAANVNVQAKSSIGTSGNGSHAILAQSVGGGGGEGGQSLSFTDSFSTASSHNLAFSLGGGGGKGANAGNVLVQTNHSQLILTTGDSAAGILAQSVGGGGGAGGLAVAQTYTITPGSIAGAEQAASSEIKIAIGGTGGDGGRGRDVDITNLADIATLGDLAYGIHAQSIGGGGGSGGASGYSADGNASTLNAILSVGGAAASGNVGGRVSVVNGLNGEVRAASEIATSGIRAHGIFAQSVGGGGGAGGRSENNRIAGFINSGLSIFNVGETAANATLTTRVGGRGGDGNVGGEVSVANYGLVHTTGLEASGIFAQSVGGGGGAGGGVIAPIIGQDSVLNIDFTLGGEGGAAAPAPGNHGGAVNVTNAGEVWVEGDSAHGILAQSVGGGGGAGGGVAKIFSSYGEEIKNRLLGGDHAAVASALRLTATVGGKGGVASNGGAVSVSNSGQIVVNGQNSNGISAVSIGGGGGNGGAISFVDYAEIVDNVIADKTKVLADINQQIADTEKSINENAPKAFEKINDLFNTNLTANPIDTSGYREDIEELKKSLSFARSNLTFASATNFELSIGGSGGASGDGGNLSVTNSGLIQAGGDGSIGIFAQSVGGGGGTLPAQYRRVTGTAAPGAGGTGGGAVTTYDKLSTYQGGNASNYTLAIGGAGGAAGNGGDIVITNTGTIATQGNNSFGIFAQSIGGGGGHVGASPLSDISIANALTVSGADQALLGGASGDGGDITINHTGTIIATGDNSFGIFAQSVGGSGGSAMSITPNALYAELKSVRDRLLAEMDKVEKKYLGFNSTELSKRVKDGIASADSLRATLNSIEQQIAQVETTLGLTLGARDLTPAYTLLNSIGDQLSQLDAQLAANRDLGLDNVQSTIQRYLDRITTELAFSQFNGKGGDIVINTNGNVVMTGANSVAYFAQSVSGKGGMAQLSDGTLVFGSANGGDATGTEGAGNVAIRHTGNLFAPGLNGIGFLAQSAAAAGLGDMSVEVDGDITGGAGKGVGVVIDGGFTNNIVLRGTVQSASGEAIHAGKGDDNITAYGGTIGNIRLGGGTNAFNNHGQVLFGDVIDLQGGRFTNDGLMQFRSDDGVTRATGRTVEIIGDLTQTTSGTLRMDVNFGPAASDRVNVTGRASIAGDVDFELLSLHDANPVTIMSGRKGMTLSNVGIVDTLALDFDLRVEGTDARLHLLPRYDAPVSRVNDKAIGLYFNDILKAGGAHKMDSVLLELGTLDDRETYVTAFEQLSPELYLAPLRSTYFSAEAAARGALSCNNDEEAAFDQSCSWAEGISRSLDQSATNELLKVKGTSQGVTVGDQRFMLGDWRIGMAVTSQTQEQELERGLGAASGELFNFAAAARRSIGSFSIAGSASAGYGRYDTQRSAVLLSPAVGSTQAFTTSSFTGMVKIAYTLDWDQFWVRPSMEVAATRLASDGFSEQGAGMAGLVSDGESSTVVSISPGAEVGYDWDLAEGFGLRSWLAVRAEYRPDQELSLSTRFANGAAGGPDFRTKATLDEEIVVARAGLNLHNNGSVGVGLAVEGQFGESQNTTSATIGASIRF
jgi:hypothetical protein